MCVAVTRDDSSAIETRRVRAAVTTSGSSAIDSRRVCAAVTRDRPSAIDSRRVCAAVTIPGCIRPLVIQFLPKTPVPVKTKIKASFRVKQKFNKSRSTATGDKPTLVFAYPNEACLPFENASTSPTTHSKTPPTSVE